MIEFPKKFVPKYKHKFSDFKYERDIAYLRREIFEHVIRGDENNYFELDRFCRERLGNDRDIMEKMKDDVIIELEELGWKCQTSYGGTALFIYSSNDPPSSCYPDGI